MRRKAKAIASAASVIGVVAAAALLYPPRPDAGLRAVNMARHEAGVATLRADPVLRDAAREMAHTYATITVFDEVLAGQTPTARVRRLGYPGQAGACIAGAGGRGSWEGAAEQWLRENRGVLCAEGFAAAGTASERSAWGETFYVVLIGR